MQQEEKYSKHQMGKKIKLTNLERRWVAFWMRRSDYTGLRRIATWLASWFTPPHYYREVLATITDKPYISPKAVIYHSDIRIGKKVFIDDRCLIFQDMDGGPVELGYKVRIYRDVIAQTGHGGSIVLAENTSLHPRCQIIAYVAPIHIGKHTMIAGNCALYSYDHGCAPGVPVRQQPLTTRGGIFIGDEAWIGTGAIILSGVTIGDGAIIGAGSIVTRDIPAGAIAAGNPARVIKMRDDVKTISV